MSKKDRFRLQGAIWFLTILLCSGWLYATQYYTADEEVEPTTPTNYEIVTGDPLTVLHVNAIHEHIDDRIDTLETQGSNIFSTVTVSGQDNVVADTSSDTLTLVAGANFTITTSASGDSIQFDVSTTPLDILNGGVEVVAGATDLDFDANFSITDEGSNEAGVALVDDPTIAGFLTITEFLDMAEMAAPANPAANVGRIYVADTAGTTTLYFVDNAGTATNLLAGASDEAIQDLVGAMTTGNTETLITVTYQDADGTVDFVVNSDLHSYSWTNVVDADITNTLTASIFVGSGSTTNAVDLATAEVSGILPRANVADEFIRNNANDVTTGNINLFDGVGDSPQLIVTDAGGDYMALDKINGGVAGIYANDSIIGLLPNGDIDDYLSITTVANVPTISTVGSCNLVISPSSGVIDLDGCSIIGMSSIDTDDNLTLDDSVGDSPYLRFVDADDYTFTLQKLDSGAATLINDEGGIVLMPSGDVDDYLSISTTTNEIFITAVGTTSQNYGGATVTDHTFITDSTGDAEIVLPADSIGDAEIDWSGLTTSADFTVTGTLFATVGVDTVGAADLDIGSADVLDITLVEADSTVIIDGGITISTGDTLTIGTTQWDNGSDAIDGNIIANDTIDADSIAANAIEEQHLKAVNTPTDEYVLTYEATTGDFEWESIVDVCHGHPILIDTFTNGAGTNLAANTVVLTKEGVADTFDDDYSAGAINFLGVTQEAIDDTTSGIVAIEGIVTIDGIVDAGFDEGNWMVIGATGPTFTTTRSDICFGEIVELIDADSAKVVISRNIDRATVDGELIDDDTIDDDSIDWGAGADQVDIADIPGGTAGANAFDLGGATSLEIPNGEDPDVDADGEISYDTGNEILRGFDGTNQVVLGQGVGPKVMFTVSDPLYLSDPSTYLCWRNLTGKTLNITAIYSMSDTDDTVFTLVEAAGTDFTSLTTIEAITIATNGTGVFYNDLTSGIDHTVIESGNSIVFNNDAADDPDWIQVTIVGWYNAND